MSYQEELQAKLDAVRPSSSAQDKHTLDTIALEEKLVNEIETEFEVSQYDLDESDILRTIKILAILNTYEDAFTHHKALSILYVLAKTDVIQAKNLLRLSKVSATEFKEIIKSMSRHKLIRLNDNKEIEITTIGMSLAERIGFDVFI